MFRQQPLRFRHFFLVEVNDVLLPQSANLHEADAKFIRGHVQRALKVLRDLIRDHRQLKNTIQLRRFPRTSPFWYGHRARRQSRFLQQFPSFHVSSSPSAFYIHFHGCGPTLFVPPCHDILVTCRRVRGPRCSPPHRPALNKKGGSPFLRKESWPPW